MGYAPIKAWYLGLPTKELLDEYEKHKTKFTTELNEEIMQELQSDKKIKPLAPQQKIIYDLNQKGYTDKDISKLTGKSRSLITRQKQLIIKKGHKWQDNQENTTLETQKHIKSKLNALST